MLKYILKRFVIFIPTLIIISVLAFVISVNAPGDPVERLSKSADKEGGANTQSNASKKVKEDIRKRLGLDLPIFYFSLSTLADCDTLYKITDKAQQDNLLKLTRKHGNWKAVSRYYHALTTLLDEHAVIDVEKAYLDNSAMSFELVGEGDTARTDTTFTSTYSKNDINNAKNSSSFAVLTLLESYNDDVIESKISELDKIYSNYKFFKPLHDRFSVVRSSYTDLKDSSTVWKTNIPVINFYGKNQYGRWLFGDAPWFKENTKNQSKGVLRGDFGTSYIDNQPVSDKIWKKFQVSFIFIIISIILAYLVSIPLGIYSAYMKDSKFDKISSVIVFTLYSMPSFFVGTLLLYTFANPDVLVWFPESGWQDPSTYDENWNVFKRMAHHWPYMVLPLITYTYSSFTFLSRIMRVGMIDIMNHDFIRTARAKGLNEKTVVLKHALRNSLIPIITVFANIFPVAIGGSVIIEVIFSLPGMGLETFNAVLNYDYPMIVAIFTISGFLTIVGYLIADILYAVVDPRISYS
jgi:peptide/nickel transport system permease protein